MATSGVLMTLVKRENVLAYVPPPGEGLALDLCKKHLAIISAGNSPIPESSFMARGAPPSHCPCPNVITLHSREKMTQANQEE